MKKEIFRDLKIGPGASILDVPENKEFLKEIESAKELSPEDLLELAKNYREHPTTVPLANRLAFQAMAMLSRSPSVNKAMGSIAETEIEWSWWGDAWKSIKEFFGGGTGDRTEVCKIKCFGIVLIEKCGDKDSWHIIGICLFGKF